MYIVKETEMTKIGSSTKAQVEPLSSNKWENDINVLFSRFQPSQNLFKAPQKSVMCHFSLVIFYFNSLF